MTAYGYILLPEGYARGDAPVRDIAYAMTRERADAIILEVHPGCRIFASEILGAVESA